MKKLKIKTNNSNPNFTIILPGTCQASCDFCHWKEDKNTSGFIKSLKNVLKLLPSNFTQISISGGEPTLSPVFGEALTIINKYKSKGKIKKVVLTTNGINIRKLDLSGIDHINISRHSFNDKVNYNIFKTKNVPSFEDLVEINNYINLCGIDVNYNAVVIENINDVPDVLAWTEFVQATNATSVTFRSQYGIYGRTKLEESLLSRNFKSHSVNTCPVCRTSTYFANGIKLKFHSSDYEPIKSESFDKDEVYELILQQNGDLTRDWEAKEILLTKRK